MDELLAHVRLRHYPNEPATQAAIDAFQQSSGLSLPDEMRRFYLNFDGACLFEQNDPPMRIMRLSELTRVRVAMFGEDDDQYGPDSEYVFCELFDGNYAAVRLRANCPTYGSVIDCFHETYPDQEYWTVVGATFAEFLSKALQSGGSYTELL